MSEQEQSFYTFGDYTIEKTERLLMRNGEAVPLPPKIVELLFLLLESDGIVITKEEMMNRLWPDSFVDEANLSRNIFQLRSVLGPGESGKFIETIPRRGYRFVTRVTENRGNEATKIISQERTLSVSVIEEEIETGHKAKIAAQEWRSAPFVFISLLILILGAIATAGYFVLSSRESRQKTRIAQQRPISTFPGSHSSASFSPDGESIAFINEINGVQQVWIKNLAGGEPLQITSGKENAERPRWSPVGNELVYVRHTQGNRSIWRVSKDGINQQKIIEGGRNPNWSGDGTRLAFERGYDIWTANKDGSDQRRIDGLPSTDLLLADRMPAFSPDGLSIAFFQNDKGPSGDYWVIGSSGGELRRLTFDNIFGGAPTWTHDGESIVFPSQRAGSMTLWKVRAAGGQPEPVLNSAGEDTEPEISRDGRKLIYTNSRNSYILTVTDPATRESRQLKESRLEIVDPSFSPDGGRIAFFGISEDGDISIFTIDLDAKNLTQITRSKGERNGLPQWSADGSSIYFYQLHPTTSFRKISASGGESSELVSDWQWSTHNGAQVDPEGKRIVYSKMDKGSAVATMIRDISTGAETAFSLPLRHARWSHNGMFIAGTDIPGGKPQLAEIVVCQVENGSCNRVAKGSDPHWSFDDTTIYYAPFTDFDGKSLWMVSREGGEEKKIFDLSPTHPIGDFFDVSPNNLIVWVQYRRGKQEMWLADLTMP